MRRLGLFKLQIGQKRISILLLSIILPVSLLTGLRLTGVLREPPTPEVLTADAVAWSMSRPSSYADIAKVVNNSYTDDRASIDMIVHVCYYYENDPVLDGLDNVYSDMLVNVSVSEGFVESFFVNFTELDEHAALDVNEDMDNIDVVNVEVSRIVDWNLAFGRNAYISATSINRPTYASLRFIFAWLFKDPNNANHVLPVTFVATVFNGAAYQRIEVPIQMEVLRRS